MFKRLFSKWKLISHKAGDFQANVFLTVFYFTIFAPFALIFRAFSDPMKIKRPPAGWEKRDQAADTLDNAREQF